MTRKHAILFPLTLLVIAVSYAPSLSAPFVADDYTIYSSAFLSKPLRYFHQDLWGQVGMKETYLRPLVVLTFAGDNLLRGQGTFVPHMTNLLLHLTVTGLVGLMVLLPSAGQEKGRRMLGAVAGMLFFGLHPLAVEAVAWVSGRWEIVAALFGMFGLCTWIQLDRVSLTAATGWRYVGLLCFTAALLSKETAVVFVAAAFLWKLGRLLRKRSARQTRLDWISTVSLIVLSLVYLVYRQVVLGHIGLGNPPVVFSWRLLLVRILVLAWPFSGTGGVPFLTLYILIILATGGLLIWAILCQKGGERVTGFPWALPLTVLVLNLIMLSMEWENVRSAFRAEVMSGMDSRFSYPGVLALAVLIGWVITRLDALPRRWTAAALTFTIVSAFVWPQQYRIFCWKVVGQRVDSFLSRTVALVPNPEKDSVLIFKGLPLRVKTMGHVYFFGIGLQEAVTLRYHRSDLIVNRFPTREIIEQPPDNVYIFFYDFGKDALSLTHKPEASAKRGRS